VHRAARSRQRPWFPTPFSRRKPDSQESTAAGIGRQPGHGWYGHRGMTEWMACDDTGPFQPSDRGVDCRSDSSASKTDAIGARPVHGHGADRRVNRGSAASVLGPPGFVSRCPPLLRSTRPVRR
jgi:hypothetical protein